MSIKGVIFDLDGTLYDNSTLPRHLVLHNIFNLRLLYAERVCRHRMSGRYFGDKGLTYRALFSRMSAMSGKSVDKVSKWYWDVYLPLQVRILSRHFHKKSWVDAVLDDLRAKGVRLACFSEYGCIREKLKAIGVEPSKFDYIVDAPTAGGCKPCRKAFLYVAAEMDCCPADILMVGDREDTDGAGADSANMRFLLVPKADTGSLELPF